MVDVYQGEVWWAEFAEPKGSEPGFRRPVLVVQGDHFNRSRIAAVVCVPLSSNLKWQSAPGNVLIVAKASGLPKDSVANVSQIVTLDRSCFDSRTGKIPKSSMDLVMQGIDTVLGREIG